MSATTIARLTYLLIATTAMLMAPNVIAGLLAVHHGSVVL